MNLPRSTQTTPLQKGSLAADGTTRSLLSLGIPSIPCVSVWILLPCFLPCLERGFLFKSFINYSSLNPPPPCFVSQSSFIDWLVKRQNPQSQCRRHCPLITPKHKLGGEDGWAVLSARIPTHQCPERPRQPGQPPASARIRGAPDAPRVAVSTSGHTRSDPLWPSTAAVPHLLRGTLRSYFVAFVFSFFLLHVVAWGNDSQSSCPHVSSLCHRPETNPLRLPGPAPRQRQKPWNKARGLPAQRTPPTESLN